MTYEKEKLEKIKKYGVRNFRLTDKGVVVFDIYSHE